MATNQATSETNTVQSDAELYLPECAGIRVGFPHRPDLHFFGCCIAWGTDDWRENHDELLNIVMTPAQARALGVVVHQMGEEDEYKLRRAGYDLPTRECEPTETPEGMYARVRVGMHVESQCPVHGNCTEGVVVSVTEHGCFIDQGDRSNTEEDRIVGRTYGFVKVLAAEDYWLRHSGERIEGDDSDDGQEKEASIDSVEKDVEGDQNSDDYRKEQA